MAQQQVQNIRIDNDEIRIDTDLLIRIDMEVETVTSARRRYVHPLRGGEIQTIWKGRSK